MASLLELAQLSNAVYEFKDIPTGWSETSGARKTGGGTYANGLQAAVYTGGGDTVVAFRGTDPSVLGDLTADAMLGTGMNCSYFSAAEAFVEGLGSAGNDAILCGHSLGGAITQIVGNRKGLRFATFNAPGVAVFASRNILSANKYMTGLRAIGATISAIADPAQALKDAKAFFNVVRGVNVRLRLDPVSAIGVHYGDVISIETPTWNPGSAHGIGMVIEALKACDTGKLKI